VRLILKDRDVTPESREFYEIPVVHETALAKSMVFSDIDIQSRMSVARPDELQFEYTRLMMGVLLFQPQPKRILMVGLGGGSLAKFCYKHLPDTHITVVEINPHVIDRKSGV